MTIPTALQNKIKATSQAVRWGMSLGSVFQFRAFCCDIDSDGIMGVSKDPVPLLTVNPNPACVGDRILWDMTDSYAPGSTITAWEIDFDNGTGGQFSGGAIGGAAGSYSYPSGSGSGEGAEDIADTYLVTAEVSEGGGLSQDLERELEIEDCKEVNKQLSWSYVGTDGQGVWYINWGIGQAGSGSGSGTGGGGGSGSGTGTGSVVPEWVAKNTGLTDDALNVRHLAMKPGSEVRAPETHELWAATKGGVFRTINGGDSWARIVLPDPSNVEFGDSPAITVGQLDYRQIVFATGDSNTVYVLAEYVEG